MIEINSSALKWTYCPRAYKLRVLDGLDTVERKEALEIGTAVHDFVDKCYKMGIKDNGVGIQRLVNGYAGPAPKEVFSLCGFYPLFTPINQSEVPFSIKLSSDFSLYGTIDQVYMMPNGTLLIRDLKTTKHWKISEVMTWYKYSTQMAFYTYVAKTYPRQVFPDNPLIATHAENGVFMQVQVGQRPGGNSRPCAKWYDSPIYSYDLDLFATILGEQLQDIKHWDTVDYPMDGWGQDKCGRCIFNRKCHDKNISDSDAGLTYVGWKGPK
jgi:hypothetical protein